MSGYDFMSEQYFLNRPDILRILRYTGMAILLVLLLAEVLTGLPTFFGLHAVLALLASLVLVLVSLVVGRIFDRARSALIDD